MSKYTDKINDIITTEIENLLDGKGFNFQPVIVEINKQIKQAQMDAKENAFEYTINGNKY